MISNFKTLFYQDNDSRKLYVSFSESKECLIGWGTSIFIRLSMCRIPTKNAVLINDHSLYVILKVIVYFLDQYSIIKYAFLFIKEAEKRSFKSKIWKPKISSFVIKKP